MNLQKCANGHFYDADKYQTCPHCQTNDSDDPKTIGRFVETSSVVDKPIMPTIPRGSGISNTKR